MLSGAGVIDKTAGNKIVHTTFEGTVTTGTSKDYIVVPAKTIAGYTPITKGNALTLNQSSGISELTYDNFKIYGMILDAEQISVVDYLGSGEIVDSYIADDGKVVEGKISKGDLVLELNAQNTVGNNSTNALNGRVCRVDCYSVTTNAAVTTLTVDAENFGGTFYIEAETLFRDEATGQDFPATFVIPKGKIQGNFTFNMASTGDPSTFDFKIDCTVGSVRGAGADASKVLYAIDIIDTISSSSAHTEKGTKDLYNEETKVASAQTYSTNASKA